MNLTDYLLAEFYKSGRGFDIRTQEDANGRVEYIGIAPAGSSTSEAVWKIVKITYTANNTPSLQESSNAKAVWDNYTSYF